MAAAPRVCGRTDARAVSDVDSHPSLLTARCPDPHRRPRAIPLAIVASWRMHISARSLASPQNVSLQNRRDQRSIGGMVAIPMGWSDLGSQCIGCTLCVLIRSMLSASGIRFLIVKHGHERTDPVKSAVPNYGARASRAWLYVFTGATPTIASTSGPWSILGVRNLSSLSFRSRVQLPKSVTGAHSERKPKAATSRHTPKPFTRDTTLVGIELRTITPSRQGAKQDC